MVGTEETRLVVVRGNSASGKSSVAAGLRERFGLGLALVGQDNLRRIVLWECEGGITRITLPVHAQRMEASLRKELCLACPLRPARVSKVARTWLPR